MEVAEVIRLADWFDEHTTDVEPKYSELVGVLQNNTQQPTQQPVTEPLKALSKALAAMPTQELSMLQMRVLEDVNVADLVGKRGKQWLNQSVKATTYDPATTFQTIEKANQRIGSAKRQLAQFKSAASSVGFDDPDQIDAPSPYVMNIVFQREASINDVRDWKKTASDWELIVSGVAGVVGEKAEDVKVVGTSNGSIILKLSATPLITKIMAVISKHIASIANDYLDFQLKREELRRSRMMSDAIEKDLKRQENERRQLGKVELVDEVKEIVPSASPEAIGKLEKAVDKHITFSENGGEVDFVTPPAINLGEDDADEDLAATVDDIRKLIEEHRAEVQQMKLLTLREEDDDD